MSARTGSSSLKHLIHGDVMAALGTLVTTYFPPPYLGKHVTTEFGSEREVFGADCNGVIPGIVVVSGVPVPYADVWLFHRGSKIPIRRTVSSAMGEFSFHDLYGRASAYFAVAFDPEGGEVFNALIYDQLTPS